MLTKEERAAIAEKVRKVSVTDRYGVYRAVTGKSILDCSPAPATLHDMSHVILDLCDTSNMLELPVDKNGEVIRIGDTVYDNDGEEYKVTGYRILFDDADIFLSNGSEPVYTTIFAHYLTHKQPVTIKSLAQRIKHVLEDEATSIGVNPYVELGRIAEQLESLGDSDEA